MFDSKRTLRHLPFFEELAAQEEGSPAWKAASAGLVVLRLVDERIETGLELIAADDASFAAAQREVLDIEQPANIQSALQSILDTLGRSSVVDVSSLMARLMTYGHLLEYDAHWALASDVYRTIIAHADPVAEADVAAQSHIRLGYCLRQLGNLAASVDTYRTAGEIAARANDMVGVLRARIGEAKAAIAHGNMPDARAILDDTVARAAEHKLTEVHSMALHDRAMVAYFSGDYELAVSLAYEAMERTQSARERDRLLGDIASALYELGVRSGARDAFMILAATGQEQYARWFATLNLMEIAAEDGQQLVFENYRRSINPHQLPPALRIQYLTTSAAGFDRFSRAEQATELLQRALALAEESEFHQLAFEIEATLKERSSASRIRKPVVREYQPGEAVESIIRALRDRRELVVT